MNLSHKVLQSPFTLAFLVGLFPILFYVSNNWFTFSVSRGLSIVATFSLIIFAALGSYYWVLSMISKKLFKNAPTGIAHQLFVFTSILVVVYFMRWPILTMVTPKFHLSLYIVIMLFAIVLSWFEPKKQTLRLNNLILILCLSSLGSALYSIVTTGPNVAIGSLKDEPHYALYDRVTFNDKPNVYYLTADGYPNKEALEKIFDLDNTAFYQQLKSSGFTIYDSTFSNYMATLVSLTSLFSMSHHYYGGSAGIFELLNARELIAGKQNPVVHIFKNNGYQVDYLNQRDTFFTRGCFIDLCSPTVIGNEIINIIIPERFRSILNRVTYRTLDGLEEKVLRHMDKVSADHRPHFVYVHMMIPSHSNKNKQTVEELASFRKSFLQKIQSANARITKLIQRIVTRDPNALIVVSSDHGAWGFGNYSFAKKEVFDGVPDDLIALDHLGINLAIRWPGDGSKYNQEIRSSVNLFRYIFAFLSESDDILTTKRPDHGYIMKRKGKAKILVKAVHDGEVLKQLVEMDSIQ